MSAQMTALVGAIVLALVMLIGGGAIVYRRSTGWGPNTIQAFGLVLLVPLILMLAVSNAVSKDILAVLLGGVAGYVFGRGTWGSGDGGR